MKKLYTIKEAIEEIQGLRGQTVSIYNQIVTLSDQISEGYIDVIDVLKKLESMNIELDIKEMEKRYNREFTDSDDFMGFLFNYDIVEQEIEYHTYYDRGSISNHMRFTIHKIGEEEYITTLAIHRYGDIKLNYTDNILLHHFNMTDILEVLINTENIKNVTINDIKLSLIFYSGSSETVVEQHFNDNSKETIGFLYGTFEEVIKELTHKVKKNKIAL